ncbi:aldose 1-epimerase [Hirschia litorea]|uniref:Aldose 1-epimerase n=1 Tax=Hirschia litorea TaxID=1199156 RepID=A0ABW2INM1_9PROT
MKRRTFILTVLAGSSLALTASCRDMSAPNQTDLVEGSGGDVVMISLQSGDAEMTIIPEMGGGIGSLSMGERPILRPWSGEVADGPFELASIILIPFTNRLTDGIVWKGQHYDIPQNIEGAELPLHGDAFQRPWQISETSGNIAEIVLPNGSNGPFKYSAKQKFELSDNSVKITLSITNEADIELPYGFGFHPWFPRDEDTKLTFKADKVGLQNEMDMPDEYIPIAQNPYWDYSQGKVIPKTEKYINNDFTGWDRVATLEQGQRFTSVKMTASENLSTAMMYTPAWPSDIVCFEPVSHQIDATRVEGAPGMIALQPKETVSAWMKLEW